MKVAGFFMPILFSHECTNECRIIFCYKETKAQSFCESNSLPSDLSDGIYNLYWL